MPKGKNKISKIGKKNKYYKLNTIYIIPTFKRILTY